jgi:hypothetical protein
MFTQRHRVGIVVHHHRAVEARREPRPDGIGIPARHDGRADHRSAGEVDGPRHREADAADGFLCQVSTFEQLIEQLADGLQPVLRPDGDIECCARVMADVAAEIGDRRAHTGGACVGDE